MEVVEHGKGGIVSISPSFADYINGKLIGNLETFILMNTGGIWRWTLRVVYVWVLLLT